MQRQNASKVIDEVTQAMVNRKAVNVPASLIRRDSSNNSNVSYTNYENSGQHQQDFNEEVPQESCIPQSNPSTSLKLYHMMSKSCGDENDLPHNNYQQHQALHYVNGPSASGEPSQKQFKQKAIHLQPKSSFVYQKTGKQSFQT